MDIRFRNRQQIFVANRMAEMLETSQSCQLRHVPGILNSADDGTRGLKVSDFTVSSSWFTRPDFSAKKEITGR